MLKLLLCIAVTLSISWGAKLNIACQGVGTAIRDDRDLCSYWRCLENNNVVQVRCPLGFRVPCSMTSTNGECIADPCTEKLDRDQCSAATCREYEPPEDTTTIDGDSVASYIELCLPTSGAVSEAQLLSRGSARCDPPEEDQQDTAPKSGFMFNDDTGFCEQSTSKDYGKVFDSEEECRFTCEDPCQQPLNRGITGCGDQVEAYYYDEKTRRCKSFQYLGCGGNKNRFDSSRDCWLVCVSDGPNVRVSIKPWNPWLRARVPGTRRTPAVTRGRGRPTVGPPPSSSVNNQQAFCRRIDKASPLLAKYLLSIHDISFYQTNTLGIGELADAVDELVTTPEDADVPQIGSQRVKRQFNPGGLIPKRLFWATVIRRRSCRRFDVTVRIFCVNAIIRPPPSAAESRRMCNLIASGIQQYWTREIVINGQTWDFVVRVKQQYFLGKMVVLKYFEKNEGNTRSHNFDISPMTMKYPAYLTNRAIADQEFSETGAHELAHSVLMNDKGMVWSWGHKGTSTIFGANTPNTPTFPTEENSDIDLMLYYADSDDPPEDYFDRVKLTQADAIAVIREATFFFALPWCPGELGAPCISDSQCNSGHCHGLRCVECEADNQCDNDEYCHGINNLFIVNRCRARRPNGQFCVRDRMCISGRCDGARCVECEQDNQCSATQFCYGKNTPLIVNRCQNRRSRGSLCTRNAMCLTNRCAGGRCVDCEADSHCSSTRYCHGINVPLDINECRVRRGTGSLCVRDRMCASGHCHGGRCGECSGDGDCPSNQYCKHRDKPLVTNLCRGKRCTGWCNRDRMCKSNNCRWARCKKC